MYLAFMKVNFLLVSPRNVKFDPEKIWFVNHGRYLLSIFEKSALVTLGEDFFTSSNFCWRQQKIEIHLSQQQKIILTRLTPVESPDKVK